MGDRGVRVVVLASILTVLAYAGLGFATGGLAWQLEPRPTPFPAGALERLWVVSALFTALTFPGVFIALAMPADGPREPVALFLKTLGWSTLAYIVNLKLVGARTPQTLLLIGGLEAAAAIVIARRSAHGWGSLRLPGRHEWAGLGLCAALVLGLIGANQGFILRELGDYWYSAEVMTDTPEPARASLAASGVTLDRGADWERVPAGDRDLFRKRTSSPIDRITLRALSPTRVMLRFLWQGPVGSRLRIVCEDVQQEAVVQRAPVEQAEEGPTLRYLDRGIVLVSLPVLVREERTCELEHAWGPTASSAAGPQRAGEGARGIEGEMAQAAGPQRAGEGARGIEGEMAQAAGPRGTGEGAGTLIDLTGWPIDALPDPAFMSGWSLSHYYQILNIAENVEWARRTLEDQWVTINQPPLWSYVYSAVTLYVGDGLWAIDLFFFLMIGLTVWLAARLVALEHGEVPWPFWIPLILLGVSHARIIVASGSTNFPDNLYAFGILATLYALVQGDAAGFAGAGLATSLLRYPGSALTGIAAGLVMGAYPGRRRATLRAALWFLAAIILLCLGFLVVAAATGQLEQWLDILYFETLPEHFHGQYDPGELLRRPPEFYGMLLRYTGYIPVLLLAMKGRMARWVTLLAVIYSGFLCFIDHFPSHYFVPLLYLTGVAVTASCLARPGPVRWLGLGLSCAGLSYALLQPLT
jgi:hypothetical protein